MTISPRADALGGVREERPLMLLLVEDDAGDAVLVEDLLEDSGIRAKTAWARSLKEARVRLAEEPFDCVLLDLHLTDAQGFDALTVIRTDVPRAAVVVLTGLAETWAGMGAVAAGAQDYLVKGRIDPQDLGRTIRYAVQRKQVEIADAEVQAGRLRAEENARLERGLLPRPLVDAAQVEVVTRYRPATAHSLLGGDFFDVVQTADGAVHAVIGDVAGHGPGEAALGVCLRVAWRSLVLAGTEPSRMADLLERMLVAERENEETFVTLTSLTLPPDRATARVLRAGHPGLILRGPDGAELVEPPGGLALGMVPGVGTWDEHPVPLPPGGRLMLFTDGLFEGRTGAGNDRLDVSGLLELARAGGGRDDDAFVDEVIARAVAVSAEHGGHEDDVAVIHLGWRS